VRLVSGVRKLRRHLGNRAYTIRLANISRGNLIQRLVRALNLSEFQVISGLAGMAEEKIITLGWNGNRLVEIRPYEEGAQHSVNSSDKPMPTAAKEKAVPDLKLGDNSPTSDVGLRKAFAALHTLPKQPDGRIASNLNNLVVDLMQLMSCPEAKAKDAVTALRDTQLLRSGRGRHPRWEISADFNTPLPDKSTRQSTATSEAVKPVSAEVVERLALEPAVEATESPKAPTANPPPSQKPKGQEGTEAVTATETVDLRRILSALKQATERIRLLERQAKEFEPVGAQLRYEREQAVEELQAKDKENARLRIDNQQLFSENGRLRERIAQLEQGMSPAEIAEVNKLLDELDNPEGE
jgi:hypothetical protein